MCTYAGDFSLFFTVPSVTVPYLFLVTGDMVTIELVNIPCVRMRVRTQECFFLFLLSPRHLVIFRSTSGRLQSKNVFSAKIQQTKRSNLTFRSFRFFSFDSFFSFFSPLIVHRLFVWLVVCCYRSSLDMILTTIYLQCKRYIIMAITQIIFINKWIIPKPDSTVGLR